MKRIFYLLIFCFLYTSYVKADEGMWIPLLLKKYNIEDMQKKGFKLTAEDIYSINQASMKDAVVIFGRGCTGELISDQGLIITNHHCGYGQIQQHSSVEHDYLTDGFWAMSKEEELINPGLTVTFLVRMEDVSREVLKGVNDEMDEAKRHAIVAENTRRVEAEAVKGTNYTSVVKPFFNGNQYFLFVNEVYKDVRLVGAPPSAIGKFGGDTDNWMWPRHTGDFSLFRIYADKNNKPAEYSKDNLPYKPKKYFPISMKGVKRGDFTMVFGYPGSTQEYLPACAVELTEKVRNPARIHIRQKKIDIMLADMNQDKAVRIKYAAKHARVSNAWKKWIGENRGLRRLNAVERKRQQEKKFQEWANAEKSRAAKYGTLLADYEKLYEKIEPYVLARDYAYEAGFTLDILRLAGRLGMLVQADKNNEKDTKKQIDDLKSYVKHYFKDYNLATDKKLFKEIIKIYYEKLPRKYQPEEFSLIETKFDNDLGKYTEYLYKKSILANETKLNAFLSGFKPSWVKKLTKDPVMRLSQSLEKLYDTTIMTEYRAIMREISALDRKYMKALLEFQKDKLFYPDANFTLRVAYGKVDDYYPYDGVHYLPFTTLEGIMDKDNPDIYDYKVPQKLKQLFKDKDYGQYAENGKIHVCFTASNHTTGGNSGSPVLNADGHLIGVNFDRNWEGTMSDIMYDPNQCRNISLDIRYALFLIDKFAGAGHLIKEMTLITE